MAAAELSLPTPARQGLLQLLSRQLREHSLLKLSRSVSIAPVSYVSTQTLSILLSLSHLSLSLSTRISHSIAHCVFLSLYLSHSVCLPLTLYFFLPHLSDTLSLYLSHSFSHPLSLTLYPPISFSLTSLSFFFSSASFI